MADKRISPEAMSKVLRPHLEKIHPHIPPKTGSSLPVFMLHIHGAIVDTDGNVVATGDGTFGHISPNSYDKMYKVLNGHMPDLKNIIEMADGEYCIAITCEISLDANKIGLVSQYIIVSN